ncbi:mitochondrial pyruvate carrier family protein [Rhodotorula paludigena]|uniref:mitochondrial pyruvate carrier family protein n=1 Tax=Rhodotorula paludigena TaxID=86838 RepID=UPI0031748036
MAAPAAASSSMSSKLTQLWNSPAGPKTVFFWAPMFKWGLVAAGLKDLSRPAEVISVPQNLALTATGLIWVRYSFVITPVNYSLAAVNCFVAGTGITSLYRAWDWQRKSPAEQAKIKLELEAENAKTKVEDAVTKIKA